MNQGIEAERSYEILDVKEMPIAANSVHTETTLRVFHLQNNFSRKEYIWSCIKDDLEDNAPS